MIPAPVTGTIAIIDLDVTISIDHPQDGDLDIFLVSPAGTRIELSTDNGGAGDILAQVRNSPEAQAFGASGKANP